MKVSTLFSVLSGPAWRPVDIVVLPVVETYVVGNLLYTLSYSRTHTFGGIVYFLGLNVAVIGGALARRWVVRNRTFLRNFFSETNRNVAKSEFLVGLAYAVWFLMEARLHLLSADTLWDHIDKSIWMYHFSFRYLWINFILLLYLNDVNYRLERRQRRGGLMSYKHSCSLLESVNMSLSGLLDHLLLSTVFSLVILGSLASKSRCNFEIMMVVWVSHFTIPHATLVSAAGRTAKVMLAKRARFRRNWPKCSCILEMYAIGGHRNGRGLRWVAESQYMNSASSLSMLSDVLIYASLILTTPMFLQNGSHDLFCADFEYPDGKSNESETVHV